MKNKSKKTNQACPNCGIDGSNGTKGEVTVICPCPSCVGGGILEIDALRALYAFMKLNVATRSRPPKILKKLLENIAQSRGEGL